MTHQIVAEPLDLLARSQLMIPLNESPSNFGNASPLRLEKIANTARHLQQILKEQRRAPFALPKVSHQQAGKSDQSRTALAVRYTGGQRGAGRDSATPAGQAVLLIFRHHLVGDALVWHADVACSAAARSFAA
ncbi:MAG: hypothetical protein IID44_23420 [Planctomycetes bacterium]|nr:hypothetical protein [Planctomycetota bacterium]